MSLLRRFLGVLILLISTVCFIGCVAGLVGIWMARQDLTEKVRKLSTRIEVGIERASAANRDVGRALDKARSELAKVNKELAEPLAGEKNRRPPGVLQRLVLKEAGPKLNDLGGRLAMSSDAMVVISSLLQSLQELPLGQTGRINPERLEQLTGRSAQLSTSLQKLQAIASDEDTAVSEKQNAAATREVDLVLRDCQTFVNEWQTDLETAREEVPHLEARLLDWMTIIAISVTVMCAWVALSQISLFAHALKWCRARPTD